MGDDETPAPAPRGWLAVLRQIGPGLIITASIVGSGELIVTPKLGAQVGSTLLWFIVLGCLIKVFIQIELGRFAVLNGLTTLEALDTLPGPRLRVGWLLWLWLAMYAALVFQVGGIIGGIANVLALAGLPWSQRALAVLVAVSCSALLVTGRYRSVEWGSTFMVFVFTVCTVIAVAAVQWTPYRISGADVLDGLAFRFPPSFTTAFAAFGLIGVGASELIYYPYWCLEKGYARRAGPPDGSAAWVERARGWLRVMSVDAWTSLVIYTAATVAFYLLGAAVLHRKGLEVTNVDPLGTLSHMYRETYGTWGLSVFLIGGFFVLYSTVFVASASNARLLVDAVALFGGHRYRTPEARRRAVRVACAVLPCLSAGLFVALGNPVSLVFVGGLAQGLMLPFLSCAAITFHRRTDPRLRPGRIWSMCLWLAAIAMTAVGLYQVVDQL